MVVVEAAVPRVDGRDFAGRTDRYLRRGGTMCEFSVFVLSFAVRGSEMGYLDYR